MVLPAIVVQAVSESSSIPSRGLGLQEGQQLGEVGQDFPQGLSLSQWPGSENYTKRKKWIQSGKAWLIYHEKKYGIIR